MSNFERVESTDLNIGDIIKIGSNKLFNFEVLDINTWKGEVLLEVRPTDKSFGDSKSVMTTKYEDIARKRTTFKRAKWVYFKGEIYKFKCNDAVYGWVSQKGKEWHYKVALTMRYGTQSGVCASLEGCQKLVELLVLGSKTTLQQQELFDRGRK
jgi:hypothetical protein